jgi:AhpD family alkylhydroperoxidase
METRINLDHVLPEGYKAMLTFSAAGKSKHLHPLQTELIKIRTSQINGCAFCLNMHTIDARKLGETEQRIYTLPAWRETPYFSKEDQAILALTEEVTLIHQHVSEKTYAQAAKVLSEKQIAEVIMTAIVINSWNRIAIATGMLAPGN